MTSEVESYIEFLKFCLNPLFPLSSTCIADINWHKLFKFAQKQSIVGIYWMGIKSLTNIAFNKPSDEDIMEWMGYVHLLAKRNKALNHDTLTLTNLFKKHGFESCILKGQGNALLYPDPSLRTSGDIDMWVFPKENLCDKITLKAIDQDVKAVLQFCRKFVPTNNDTYHHIDFLRTKNTNVEVHYRPSFVSNPIYNKRLQKYFWEQRHLIMQNLSTEGFCVPTLSFNIIFQLSHIYKHVLSEGIGLRQLIDYYYLLKTAKLNNDEKIAFSNNIHNLGMSKIAKAISWILVEILGLDDKYLIVPKNEKLGLIILKDIIFGGNFGMFSEIAPADKGTLKHNIQKLKRDFKLVQWFPEECISEPFFRLWHYWWRYKHN